MLTVVFMLWRDPRQRWRAVYDYSAQHVRIARAMVDRHLRQPHRFVLATDTPDIDVGMPTVPLPAELLALGHRWCKLLLFAPEAYDMFGERLLYLDLDMVVAGDLDPLVTSDEFRIVRQTVAAPGMHYNSSLMLLTTGARKDVWSKFQPHMAEALCRASGYNCSDQFWIAQVLGKDEPTWGPDDGVLVFRDIMGHRDLPPGARLIIFPGSHDPSVAGLQDGYPWIRQHWRM